MRVLIITQVIDTRHPILGFFHRWVEEFARHCEQVHVICLEAGEYSLPANVHVHSLGKEAGKGKLSLVCRFYSLIWSLRHEYDGVFVHMNQIYVILGALPWRLLGKRIGLWYAHGSVPLSLRFAEIFAHTIFTCSPESFRLESTKVLVTGHGIDTERFVPRSGTKDIDLITVGRITESKNLTTLVRLCGEIRKTHPTITLTIAGQAYTKAEHAYQKNLTNQIAEEGLTEAVQFLGKVSQAELPAVLQRTKVFVTVAQNGSLDKAMLEAMACGMPVVTLAPGAASLPLGTAKTVSEEAFITEVKKVIESGVFEIRAYSDYVHKDHSLSALVPKITTALS